MNRFTAFTAAAALAIAPLALATPSTAAPAKAGSYTVTAKVNKTMAIGKETTIKVKGRVTPKAAGQKVILQQRVGNKKSWKATGDAKIKSNGTYKLTDVPSTAGKRQYRVVKPASNGIRKGVSKALDVEVYSWSPLTARPVGPLQNVEFNGATIATDYYSASIVTVTPNVNGSIEYTLGRKCLQLRATYALTDQSASTASGAVAVSADGVVLANPSLNVGTVVQQTLDIEDAFRIRFDLATAVTSPSVAYTAIGSPEVLCTA
ncbi:hypothetical protein J2X46_001682 [Nocardioides sp. BE266]|uniref:hypothetical protein n=1 Tax=Nocardioides sp. BE266 TaxID=2817725 RepID=UPI0028661CFD|nr:hypothetical protein [Nocardioides sp. BE266]MDR7252706.1 hypothetical protein [Nocardioides sp. BE266]